MNFQPSGQIKLTNISVVRLKKGGKRFEIATYKNTVTAWRAGIEKDLSEVLQIDNVFLNVSKGQTAPADQLLKCFKTDDLSKIIDEILRKGELQLGDKERSQQLDQTYREIATIIASSCVDPTTKRPHTVTMIEKSMEEVHFNVNLTKIAKVQALECIKMIQDKGSLPLQRVRMKVRIQVPSKESKLVKDEITALIEVVESSDSGSDGWNLVGAIEPGSFKKINDILAQKIKKNYKFEILSQSATEDETLGATKYTTTPIADQKTEDADDIAARLDRAQITSLVGDT